MRIIYPDSTQIADSVDSAASSTTSSAVESPSVPIADSWAEVIGFPVPDRTAPKRRMSFRVLRPLRVPLTATALFLAMPFLTSLMLSGAMSIGFASDPVLVFATLLAIGLGAVSFAGGLTQVLEAFDPTLGAYVAVMASWFLLLVTGVVPLVAVLGHATDPLPLDQILPLALAYFI